MKALIIQYRPLGYGKNDKVNIKVMVVECGYIKGCFRYSTQGLGSETFAAPRGCTLYQSIRVLVYVRNAIVLFACQLKINLMAVVKGRGNSIGR